MPASTKFSFPASEQAAPSSDPARKSPHTARASRQELHNSGAAEVNGSENLSTRLKKQGRRAGQAPESRRYIVGNWVTEQDREIILRQLFRCLGKYDPRAIPRIIAKRTGITEQAVDWTIQGTCREFEEWRREIRQTLARADEAGAATWKRTA